MRDVSTLRLALASALTAGILLDRRLSLSPYMVWCLSLPILLWCAGPFNRGLVRSLKTKKANTDMLISVSIWASFLYSSVAIFNPSYLMPGVRGHWLGTMGFITVFATFGRCWEGFLTDRSMEALGKLTRRIPLTARVIESGGGLRSVLSENLRSGDRVLVRSGEQIPVDGKVMEGNGRVDESIWTGSVAPVEKMVESRVLSGTHNKSGNLVVLVEREGTQSSLAQLVRVVREGFELKEVRAGIADGLAERFVPTVVITGVMAALLWSWLGPEPRMGHAFTSLLMILIAACPWAVTIASPAALAFGLRRSDRKGIFVRNPQVLEKLDRIDILILDKKGILTEDSPAGGITVREIVRPGARDVVRELERMGIEVVLVSGDSNSAAHKIGAEVGIRSVYAEVSEKDKVRIVQQFQKQGKKVVMVGDGMRDAGALSHADLGVSVQAETPRREKRAPVLGAGISLAAESADIVLYRRDLSQLLIALRLSLRTREVIRQNLKLAFLPHLFLIPAAAGVFWFSSGVGLPAYALWAAAGTSIISIFVNSIRRFK